MASIELIGGLYGDEQHTFSVPYVPELNEFYARTMHFEYNRLRVESGRVGLVIGVTQHDGFLYALHVGALVERIFDLAGFQAKLSSAGLITKQLIDRIGGVQGARVFKIPGVRRLLRTHGPGASFTKRSALQLIGSKDPDRPSAKFSDHADLYLEPRPPGEKLTPQAVFAYLVDKGLLRIGADLNCPSCRMTTWIPLDGLGTRVSCELCGNRYDPARQLSERDEWHYRRSGVLGAEKNAQGAVPVSLTLQQLDTTLSGIGDANVYSPSLELVARTTAGGPPCEVDFVWIIARSYGRRTVLILGECKDQGPITLDDVTNLKRVADAMPKNRFKTFVVLSQLAPFSEAQIRAAAVLNNEHEQRAILLTARELEPYFIYERTKTELGVEARGGAPEDLAKATAKIYFPDAPRALRSPQAATEHSP